MVMNTYDYGQNGNPVRTEPTSVLLTDGGDGPNRRVKVDVGEADFFAGRKFRAYKSAVIAHNGGTLSMRFTCACNFILTLQELTLTQGALQFVAYRDDAGSPIVPSGSWTDIPIIGVNRMSTVPQPPYVTQSTFQSGGTFTGGVEVDLLQVRTSSANNTATNVMAGSTDRGLPAASYYLRLSTLTGGLTVNDDAQMIYRIEWAERPYEVYGP